ncbi:MAG TPA: sigma-70 family RNA polymerase sigma factor [Pirellulales bacterium]|nr:sigma-70 family RNA polymerase sigma factor [Pirellulales bacterium]
MPDTPASLLERLRKQPDAASWDRLLAIYDPLVRSWLRRYSFQAADCDDLVQEVFGVLVRELPNFHHEGRRGAFRTWLRGVLVNRLRVLWRDRRKQGNTVDPKLLEEAFDQLQDPASDLARLWDAEHDQQVVHRLLRLLEPEFTPATWRAFRLLVLEGKTTVEVAAQLGITVNAVRLAKSRVLRRLRREAEGLLG